MIFLCGNYEIYLGQDAIGQVQVSREGLYYHFSACCRIESGGIFQLLGQWSGSSVQIGILVPEENGFCLETRIPLKRFPAGCPVFHVTPRHHSAANEIPVYPEEPFQYLSRLRSAYMLRRNNDTYIVLKENFPDGNPTGKQQITD